MPTFSVIFPQPVRTPLLKTSIQLMRNKDIKPPLDNLFFELFCTNINSPSSLLAEPYRTAFEQFIQSCLHTDDTTKAKNHSFQFENNAQIKKILQFILSVRNRTIKMAKKIISKNSDKSIALQYLEGLYKRTTFMSYIHLLLVDQLKSHVLQPEYDAFFISIFHDIDVFLKNLIAGFSTDYFSHQDGTLMHHFNDSIVRGKLLASHIQTPPYHQFSSPFLIMRAIQHISFFSLHFAKYFLFKKDRANYTDCLLDQQKLHQNIQKTPFLSDYKETMLATSHDIIEQIKALDLSKEPTHNTKPCDISPLVSPCEPTAQTTPVASTNESDSTLVEIAAIEAEISALEASIKTIEQENEKTQSQQALDTQQYEATLQKHIQREQHLVEELADIEQRLSKTTSAIPGIEKEVAQLTAQKTTLETSIATDTQKLKSIQQKTPALEKEDAKLKKMTQFLDKTPSITLADIHLLTQKEAEYQALIEVCELKKAKAQECSIALKAKTQNSQALLQSTLQTNQAMELETAQIIQSKKEAIEQIRNQIKELEQALQTQKQINAQIQDQCKIMQQTLQTWQQQESYITQANHLAYAKRVGELKALYDASKMQITDLESLARLQHAHPFDSHPPVPTTVPLYGLSPAIAHHLAIPPAMPALIPAAHRAMHYTAPTPMTSAIPDAPANASKSSAPSHP